MIRMSRAQTNGNECSIKNLNLNTLKTCVLCFFLKILKFRVEKKIISIFSSNTPKKLKVFHLSCKKRNFLIKLWDFLYVSYEKFYNFDQKKRKERKKLIKSCFICAFLSLNAFLCDVRKSFSVFFFGFR